MAAALQGKWRQPSPSKSSKLLAQTRGGPHPWVKLELNFDGAISTHKGEAVVRVIIRDKNGRVIFANSERKLLDPLIIECQAILLVLQSSIELNMDNLIIDSNGIEAMKLIQNPTSDMLWKLISLIQDCFLKCNKFCNFQVTHVYRSVNNASHCIAKEGLQLPSPSVWVSTPPCWLENVISKDQFPP